MSTETLPRRPKRDHSDLVTYGNPPMRTALVIMFVYLPPFAVLASVIFRVPEYLGWALTVGIVVLRVVAVSFLVSFWAFVSVEVGEGRVVLRALFSQFVVHADDVQRIELDPPVRTLSMKYQWWKPWSKLIIHRNGMYPID